MGQNLLQSEAVVTKWGNCYKVRHYMAYTPIGQDQIGTQDRHTFNIAMVVHKERVFKM